VQCTFKNEPNRRDYKPVFVGQVKTIEAVDKLGAVGHRDFLRMPVESVEIHAGKDRVA
jgi:hypothetical protein